MDLTLGSNLFRFLSAPSKLIGSFAGTTFAHGSAFTSGKKGCWHQTSLSHYNRLDSLSRKEKKGEGEVPMIAPGNAHLNYEGGSISTVDLLVLTG